MVREFARRGAAHRPSRPRCRWACSRGTRGRAAGGTALVLPTDVADAAAVEAAAARVEQEFGPIDVWVNDAMVSVFSPVKEMTADEFKRVTEVTYLGQRLRHAGGALRRMLPRDRGTIVQVGSALAYRGIPLQSAYCGAKHAIQGFTDSLRCELIHDKSNVTSDHGADAGAEHAAVRLGQEPPAASTRSRCRRSSSPKSPPRHLLGGASPPSRGRHRPPHCRGRRRQQVHPRPA